MFNNQQPQYYEQPQTQVVQPQNYTDTSRYAYQDTAHPELVQWELDHDKIRKTIEMNLKGYVWVATEKQFKQLKVPLLNDEGVDTIIAIVDSYLDKTIALTNMDVKQINKIMIRFSNQLDMALGFRCENWKINRTIRPMISSKIQDVVFAVLMKSREGITLDFLGNTTKIVQTNQQNQSKGFIGGLFK